MGEEKHLGVLFYFFFFSLQTSLSIWLDMQKEVNVFCGLLGRNVRLVKIYVNIRGLICGTANGDAVKSEC